MLTDGSIDHASARIRALGYIPFLEDNGYIVTHIPRVPQRPANVLNKFMVFPVQKRLYFLTMCFAILAKRWSLVYIQRVFVSRTLLKLLNNRLIPIIYDFDDAIFMSPLHPERRGKTACMIRHATKVIVSTQYLVDFCLSNGKKAEIIFSPVETNRITPATKPRDRITTIGWIGSPWTSGFLELVENPLRELSLKYNFRFLTVGSNPLHKIAGINQVSKPWIFENENDELGNVDIGIMPLPDTAYAQMKGGYKLFQYMAAGIPCVASPIGINSTIVKHGENGYLAASESEWYDALELLISNPDLRIKLGSNGRKEAVEFFSREACSAKLLKIILEINEQAK